PEPQIESPQVVQSCGQAASSLFSQTWLPQTAAQSCAHDSASPASHAPLPQTLASRHWPPAQMSPSSPQSVWVRDCPSAAHTTSTSPSHSLLDGAHKVLQSCAQLDGDSPASHTPLPQTPGGTHSP